MSPRNQCSRFVAHEQCACDRAANDQRDEEGRQRDRCEQRRKLLSYLEKERQLEQWCRLGDRNHNPGDKGDRCRSDVDGGVIRDTSSPPLNDQKDDHERSADKYQPEANRRLVAGSKADNPTGDCEQAERPQGMGIDLARFQSGRPARRHAAASGNQSDRDGDGREQE